MAVMRVSELAGLGQSQRERDARVRAGGLVRVRHGAFADEAAHDALERHRQLIAGTVPLLAPGTVLSHVSAGVLHGLPSWDQMLGRVTVLRPPYSHGSKRPHLYARTAALAASEVAVIEGLRVTTLERTAVDLARDLEFERAVAVLDSALHSDADPEILASIVTSATGMAGVNTARAALAFSDGRSESVGESVSRVRMRTLRLPVPDLQSNVFDGAGAWIARCDFAWEERGVLGEFDGRVKYTGTPDQVARAVVAEKEREARLRQLGWVVVRWGWNELINPSALRERIEAALAQGHPGSIAGHLISTPR